MLKTPRRGRRRRRGRRPRRQVRRGHHRRGRAGARRELRRGRHRRPREGQARRLQGAQARAGHRHHRPGPERQGRLQAPQGLGRRRARRGACERAASRRRSCGSGSTATWRPSTRRSCGCSRSCPRRWRPPTRPCWATTPRRWPAVRTGRGHDRRADGRGRGRHRAAPAPAVAGGRRPALRPRHHPHRPRARALGRPGRAHRQARRIRACRPAHAHGPRACSSGWARSRADLWRAAADAFVDRDPNAGDALEAADDEVDDLHTALTAELLAGGVPAARGRRRHAGGPLLRAARRPRRAHRHVEWRTRSPDHRVRVRRRADCRAMATAFKSSNPALNDKAFERAARDRGRLGRRHRSRRATPTPWAPRRSQAVDAMTVNGTVWATAALLVLVVGGGVYGWNSVDVTSDTVSFPGWIFPVALVAFGVAMRHRLQAAPGPVHGARSTPCSRARSSARSPASTTRPTTASSCRRCRSRSASSP